MKIDNTFYLISKIRELSNSLIEKELKKNNIEGISSAHGNIIHVLHKKDGITMSEISETIKRDRSTVTTLIGKLKKHGYVDLKKSDTDSRSTIAFLTEKGKNLLPSFEEISYNLFETSKLDIKEEEWLVFRRVLNKLYDNLNKK